MPPDDECSIFKYSKGSDSATSTTASSSSSSGTTSAITMSIGSGFIKAKLDQNKKNNDLNQKPSFNSPFKPFVRNNQMNLNSDGSSNSSPPSSTNKNNSSCLTKSLMLSASSSNIYYASPVHNKPSETYKIVSINNVSTLL